MENLQNAIEVRNVKKSFKVYSDRGVTLKERLITRGRNKYELRQVLKGVSFDVKKGEAIGLIGRNGCGKSTTLKLLSQIIHPNEGTIQMQGRVSSLLELGAGFHPDMSGKENIYMNASIFGLNRKEIDKRLDDIIAFSELEDFIDNPVRTYSSGMYMRLAFSVAINVNADILLVDEILAVGDISFQKKCFERLKEIKSQGTTIIVVSHSFDQIERICDRSIWIKDGKIEEIGIPKVVHGHYLDYMEEARINNLLEKRDEEFLIQEIATAGATRDKAEEGDQESLESLDPLSQRIVAIKKNENLFEQVKHLRYGNQQVQLTRIHVVDAENKQNLVFRTGDSMTVYVEFAADNPLRKGTLGLGFYREDGVYCFGTNTFIENQKVIPLGHGKGVLITFEPMNLLPGKYLMTVGMHDDIKADFYDQVDRAIPIEVVNLKGDLGIARIPSAWTFIE